MVLRPQRAEGRRFVRTLSFCLLFLLVGATNRTLAQEKGSGLGKEALVSIINAWTKRQANITSIDFHVAGTEFLPKQSITQRDLELAGQFIGTQPFTLPEISFAVKLQFALDKKGRTRLRYEGRTWSAKEKSYVNKVDNDVFDGNTRKTLFAQGPIDYPNAHIRNGTTADVAHDIRSLPILMIFRPFDKQLGDFDSQNFRLQKDKGIVDGTSCLILKHGESTLWVDPSKDFVPIRYFSVRRGILIQTVDVRYVHDPNYGWLPASWTNALFSGFDQIEDSMTVKVTEYHVNTDLPDDFFEIDLTPGTWVRNYITDERYLVLEGGKRRPIELGEFDGTNYEQLLHSDPPGKRRFWAIVIVNLAFIVPIAIWAIWRFRRQKST
jgi:hypothetical protein